MILKMKYKFFVLTTILLLSQLNFSFGQDEILIPLGSNPIIKKHLQQSTIATQKVLAVDTLDLPLIDDFSSTKVYPDQNFWTDKAVYINDHFARNPLTIGVATFDGLDEFGNAYNNSSVSIVGSADTLTSKPMNLSTKPSSAGGGVYNLGDSITLSFYYEKQGWGDKPESSDSLIVEYFNPATAKWLRQWSATGPVLAGQDTTFLRAELRLLNAAFLQDGFRFRFRSYGSLTGSQDVWHVDYIRFYKAYNSISGQMDTSLVDVAFTDPSPTMLNGFTSIPWEHFVSLSSTVRDAIINDSLKVLYRVNDITPADVGFNNRIYDYAGTYISGFGAVNGNIFPARPKNIDLSYTFGVDSIYPLTPTFRPDSTFFTIKSYFSNSQSFLGLKSNDTITATQEFYNYYSYDDGSAEAGYDLVSAPNGKLAMRFDILKPDTLRAIRFGFIQQLLDVSNKLFIIKVWSSLNPETLIYQETNQKPVYIDSINGFATYVLDQIVPVSGTIYVGFQQVSPDGLHLGFDRNTTSNSKMFFNVNGSWTNVNVADGTFLIRPVMGDSVLFVGLPDHSFSSHVNLFPNPSNSIIQIESKQSDQFERTEIYSSQGQLLKSDSFANSFSVQEFSDGIYFIRIYDKYNQVIVKRFTVLHNR